MKNPICPCVECELDVEAGAPLFALISTQFWKEGEYYDPTLNWWDYKKRERRKHTYTSVPLVGPRHAERLKHMCKTEQRVKGQ